MGYCLPCLPQRVAEGRTNNVPYVKGLSSMRYHPIKGSSSTGVVNKLLTNGLTPSDGSLPIVGLKLPTTNLESCQGVFIIGLGSDLLVENMEPPGQGTSKVRMSGRPRRDPLPWSAVHSRTAALSCRPVEGFWSCRRKPVLLNQASKRAVSSGPSAPSLDYSCCVKPGYWTTFFAQGLCLGFPGEPGPEFSPHALGS